MIFLIFFINVALSKYNWPIDKLNQMLHIPDFYFNTYKNDDIKINTNVYIIDSGISNSNDFYDNIYQKINLVNNQVYDQLGHGTFVTGQISSKTYGIIKNINITIIKIFTDNESNTDYTILKDALLFVKDDCETTTNNCIINLSLGLNERNDIIDNLLELLHNQNILIIAAAGNENMNCNHFTPSHLPFLFVVGSLNYLDMKSGFSNYGSCVDIYTYGEMIPGIGLNDQMTIMSGTSMSTPILTGYISHFWNLNPNLSNIDIQQKIIDDYSTSNYGYRKFILKKEYKNDIVTIAITNLIFGGLYIIFRFIILFF